jgi:DNA modification methylase
MEINKIYKGDCISLIDQLPIGLINCVVTSPPYNLQKNASGGGSSKMNYDGWYADEKSELQYQAEQQILISKLMDKCDGSIFYNHRIRYAWHSRNKFRVPSNIYYPMMWLSNFPIWCEIIWDRRSTTGHANGRCRLSDERIYQIGKPKVFNDMGYTTVWQMSPSKNEGHVCSFPEELVARCILMTTNEGDTVLDPYIGSGTTAIVCKKLNRNFIGFEAEDRYVTLANQNLSRFNILNK